MRCSKTPLRLVAGRPPGRLDGRGGLGAPQRSQAAAGAGTLSMPHMSRVTAIRASECPHATYRCDSATSHYDPGGVHDVP